MNGSNDLKECFETPNLLFGIPGKFWRVNDENANVRASVRKYNDGPHGPAGWYDDTAPFSRSMPYLGTEEIAREHITRIATTQALKTADIVIRL